MPSGMQDCPSSIPRSAVTLGYTSGADFAQNVPFCAEESQSGRVAGGNMRAHKYSYNIYLSPIFRNNMFRHLSTA